MTLQKKATFSFFRWRSMFQNFGNANKHSSSNHDGCAERTSRSSPSATATSITTAVKLIICIIVPEGKFLLTAVNSSDTPAHRTTTKSNRAHCVMSVLWHVLFDKRHTNYKNKDLKDKIWQSINDQLGWSGRSVLSNEALASVKEPQSVPTAS